MVLEILAAALGVSLRNVQPSSTSQYVIPWATFSNIIKENKTDCETSCKRQCSVFSPGGGYSTKFCTGRLRPVVQHLIQLFLYSFRQKWCLFHTLVESTASLLTTVNSPSFKNKYNHTEPGSFLVFFTAIKCTCQPF